MSDIPRIPAATPPALVNPQIHQVDRATDRNPRKHHEEEKAPEDILELHEESEAPPEVPAAPVPPPAEPDHLDIAI